MQEKLGTSGLEDSAVTAAKIAAAVAGSGLEGGAGSALSVKLDGATLAVSASGAKVANNGIGGSQLDAALQDMLPGIQISFGAESSHKRTITLQMKDYAANNLAEVHLLCLWIAPTLYAAPDATNNTVSVTTGTIYGTELANAAYKVITDATGKAVIDLTVSGAASRHLMAEADGRIKLSGAMTFD